VPFINDMLADLAQRSGAAESKTAHAAYENSPGLQSRFQFSPAAIMAQLRARILGQDTALAEIEGILNLVKADLGDPRRPLHVALFLGPTGVGKTELVRVLAEAIHGSADACCRIDMNTLAQAHYAAAITGAPPGYVGSHEGATLLDSERIQGSFSRPGLVLFDEIEKAGKEVIRTLLNVFDHGQLTLSSGARTIDFRNTLVFMTSNLAAREIGCYEDGLRRGWRRLVPASTMRRRRRIRRILDAALQRTFDPEFINRIDSITLFDRIGSDRLDALIELELARLNARLARSGWTVILDRDARSWLKQRGFDQRFGARALARSFRQAVTIALAAALVRVDRERGVTSGGGCLIGRRAPEGIRFDFA
jgi:ATP-dependent Clp protease ATP-binding subunit ClpA